MKLRKMSVEEINAMSKTNQNSGVRKEVWSTYDNLLNEMTPNEWMALDLTDGENKLKIRQQLTLAAKRAGVNVEFRRTRKPTVITRVVSGKPVPPPDVPITATNMETRIDADEGEVIYE